MSAKRSFKKQFGFSLIELIIVMLVVAVVGVMTLPQIIASNRLWRFSGFQREIVSLLREAHQEAISQRTAITFQYDDAAKQITLFGGNFGALGDGRNRIYQISNASSGEEIVYGRVQDTSSGALSDGVNLTGLSNQKIEVNFQSDGSVIDANHNLKNYGLYFYNAKNPTETAFAVSILGAGGRSKVWRYNQTIQIYAE